jgi:hypothetical protein
MVNVAHSPEDAGVETARYRSGVAARLAGLPVETLRVWERRYRISDTGRSAHGQRLYSDAQVRRLRLIKQLVDQGHPIGALAQLPLDQLGALALALVPVPRAPSRPARVALVGAALSRRLAGGGRELLALDVVANCRELDGAAAALAGAGAEVVLVEMAELDDSVVPVIAALRQQFGIAIVVLYRFCASATIRQLRAHGCLVARAPSDAAEIVLLCQAALAGAPAPSAQPAQGSPGVPAPRRFDDQALALLAAAGNSISCECPRHLSDILLMLNSFERYSAQCAARTAADALLHEQLQHAAGSARVLLETALERLARAEGLPLPAGM